MVSSIESSGSHCYLNRQVQSVWRVFFDAPHWGWAIHREIFDMPRLTLCLPCSLSSCCRATISQCSMTLEAVTAAAAVRMPAMERVMRNTCHQLRSNGIMKWQWSQCHLAVTLTAWAHNQAHREKARTWSFSEVSLTTLPHFLMWRKERDAHGQSHMGLLQRKAVAKEQAEDSRRDNAAAYWAWQTHVKQSHLNTKHVMSFLFWFSCCRFP